MPETKIPLAINIEVSTKLVFMSAMSFFKSAIVFKRYAGTVYFVLWICFNEALQNKKSQLPVQQEFYLRDLKIFLRELSIISPEIFGDKKRPAIDAGALFMRKPKNFYQLLNLRP